MPSVNTNKPVNFGSRATVSTLLKKLEDATTGNKDGIVNNEKGEKGSVFDTNPVLFKLRGFFDVGLSKKDEAQQLTSFLDLAQKTWGKNVSDVPRPQYVSEADWNAHLVDKAITLVRLGRDPSQVTDGFVKARGSVDGHDIAPRDVFTQTWAPTGPPSGKTIVISPGFLETGRNYVEQIQLLNKQGHEVVVMDHQWAGLTGHGDPAQKAGGAKGAIDRGFGIARDAAAVVAAHAALGKDVVIAGTSMGAGAGALGAVLMNDAGLVKLDGPPMPQGVKAVLAGPFFERTKSLPNEVLAATGKIPGANLIPLPAVGLPILSGDQASLRMIAAHATTEHLTGQAQAFHASTEDLARMKRLLESGVKPQAQIEIIHARGDTLAKFEASQEWAKLLGANLEPVSSTSHVFEENPSEMGLVLGGLKRLGV